MASPHYVHALSHYIRGDTHIRVDKQQVRAMGKPRSSVALSAALRAKRLNEVSMQFGDFDCLIRRCVVNDNQFDGFVGLRADAD